MPLFPQTMRRDGSMISRRLGTPSQPQVTLSGMPGGPGPVGTAANPSPQAVGGTSPLRPAYKATPSSGGIIQAGNKGAVLRSIAPDPGYTGQKATGFGLSPQQLSTLQSASPANRPAQTERANPLTNGGGAPQVAGTSVPVEKPTLDPGKAMGFSSKGTSIPQGQDMEPRNEASPAPDGAAADTPQGDSLTAGDGAYQRSFTNPTSASLYRSFVSKLFPGRQTPAPSSGLTKSMGPDASKGTMGVSNEDYEGPDGET